jgi:lipopolysaccharide cholinephosphotransferase
MKRTADYLNEIAKTTNIYYELSEEEKILLKKYLLDVYQDIASVCDKYKLCIMLGGGSALGAVRHHGFIPWDDDLDAMMTRKDYNKLIDIFEQELGDKYIMSVPRTEKQSKTLFMMIIKRNTLIRDVNSFSDEDSRGINVDIYAIENVPDNKFIRRVMGYIANIFRIITLSLMFYENKTELFKKCFTKSYKTKLYYYIRYIIGMIFSVFPRKYLYDKYDEFVSSSKGTKYCTIPTGRKMFHGETQPRDIFFPPSKAVFEGIEVNIPNDVDAYLAGLYGDYMTIPPEEKRERHFYTEFKLDTTK